MSDRREPVQRAADDGEDLYDVATWEVRTLLDRLSVAIYGGVVTAGRGVIVLLALGIVGAQVALTGAASLRNPLVGIYILLSVVPAFALVVYAWRSDVTSREPVRMLVVTFTLGFLFAGFAAVLNTRFEPVFQSIGFVGFVLFFYVVVAPVEETVKWLAVRLYAYRRPDFEAVTDGVVYGAAAGLGFATIENSLYITSGYLSALQSGATLANVETLQIAAVRTLAGPGHVIYSAFAGYYLGLAKFNRGNRGPIMVKGLLIAALIHATYNTAVTFLPSALRAIPPLSDLAPGVVFLGFVLVYDTVFGFVLYRKLARYRATYARLGAGDDETADQAGASDDVDETAVQVGAGAGERVTRPKPRRPTVTKRTGRRSPGSATTGSGTNPGSASARRTSPARPPRRGPGRRAPCRGSS
ncbi:PrsW family intramembrane metalloprotease [Halobacteriaceae archaeon GCM10025711]